MIVVAPKDYKTTSLPLAAQVLNAQKNQPTSEKVIGRYRVYRKASVNPDSANVQTNPKSKQEALYRFLAKVFCSILQRYSQLEVGPDSAVKLAALENYIKKFYKHFVVVGKITLTICISSLYYVNKIFSSFPEPPKIFPGAEIKLLTVSLMLAHKVNIDHAYSNKTWSRLTGISIQDLAKLEIEVLKKLNYSLHVPVETYAAWTRSLYQRAGNMLTKNDL